MGGPDIKSIVQRIIIVTYTLIKSIFNLYYQKLKNNPDRYLFGFSINKHKIINIYVYLYLVFQNNTCVKSRWLE